MGDVISSIKEHFDSENLKYMFDTSDDGTTYLTLIFNGNDDQMTIQIRVPFNEKYYIIVGSTNTKFPEEYRIRTLEAINEFNADSLYVISYITKRGHIEFSLNKSLKFSSFSIDEFKAYMSTIYSEIDEQTAYIFKKVFSKPANKRNLLSIFKK